MQVSLIYYTGMGHPIPDFAARLLAYTKNTRLEQGEDTLNRFLTMPFEELAPELEYIANTIRSSWEFVDFTFQVKDVTRAFTHQLVRTRTASFAQQTQRVVDLSGVGVEKPEMISIDLESSEAWDLAVEAAMAAYTTAKSRGIPSQDARGIVPTNIKTNIILKVNLRTLADLVGKRQNLRAIGEYGEVIRRAAAEAEKVMPWIRPFLYPERLATPALEQILRERLGTGSPVDDKILIDALKELDKLKGIWG